MPTLLIDNLPVTVPEGTTILDAAAQLGVAIPTLCHRPDLTQQAGCMICAVREEPSGRLLPACATPAAEGMRIATTAPEALELRRAMLTLLFSNHAAECEGPCARTCLAHADLPVMLEALSRGDADAALAVALERLALPGTLGAICPAPCEKACRRAAHDAPIALRAAHRWAGEVGQVAPACAPDTGKRVVIVGAGPTGLAAAFYLRRQGHTCHVIESEAAPGAALLAHVGDRLPASVLARDVSRVRDLGVTWTLGAPLAAADIAAVLADCDALVLAAGAGAAALAGALGLAVEQGLVVADRATLQTADPRVFAGGAAVRPCRMAVAACADGRTMASQLGLQLTGHICTAPQARFQSLRGRLWPDMLAALLADASPELRQVPLAGAGPSVLLSAETARREAARCFRCDCFKKETCHLRELGETCGVQAHAPAEAHIAPGRAWAAADVVFEAGKCVACGICVRLAAKQGAVCGPAFHGRGFDVRIGPPLGRAWADVPHALLLECVEACPTGAWSMGKAKG